MADVMVDQGLPSASLDAPPEAEPLPAPSPEAEPLPAPSPAESKRDREAEDEIKCAFCHEGEDSDDPDEDPLVEVNAGRAKPTYAHDQCLWWCPDITQDDELRWVNVASGAFIYFLIKGYELTKDSEGKGGAGLSRTSSRTGSPSKGSLQSGKASIRNHL